MLLHVLGLWAVAVAQPLLDLLGSNPEFFVAHRAGAWEILLLALTLVVVLPWLLVMAVRLLGLPGPRALAAARSLGISVPAGILALQVAVRAGAHTWWIAAVPAAALSVAAAFAYRRSAPFRSFLSVLAIAVLVVPAAFAARPGIRSLVGTAWTRGAGTRAAVPRPGRTVTAPVIVLVFDELPLLSLLDANRGIDPVLYPNFSALARDGVWYREATTVHDFTRYALPSILTGQFPRQDALPTAADYPDTLFTLLAGTHRLAVSEAVTAICPPSLCTGDQASGLQRVAAMGRDLRAVFLRLVLTPDLTANLPDPTATWARFDASADAAEEAEVPRGAGKRPVPAGVRNRWLRGMTSPHLSGFRRFVEGIQPGEGRPAFHFIHSLVSHHPNRLLPGGRRNKTWTDLRAERNRAESWAVVQEWQRQLLQVAFVDGLVGDLVRRLKDAGLYERSMVVVTADHGASFAAPAAPLRSLRRHTAAEIMRIPLIVKYPTGTGPVGQVSDVNAQTVDILPTVADAVGLQVTWPLDGASLLDASRQPRPKVSYAGGTRKEMPAGMLDLGPALARKLELFGSGGNPHRAPRIPEVEGLLGRNVSTLRVTEGGGRGELLHPREFEAVDPGAEDLVFDVTGRFDSPRPGALVVVAVNGVVRAATRTWESNPLGWLATPPFGSWQPGRNAVEVFVAGRDGAGTLLRRVSLGQARPPGLNLVSAEAMTVWGVRPWRLHKVERTPDGRTFRWTMDRSEIHLPTLDQPRQLEVEVLMVSGTPSKELTLEANDQVLYRGPVHRGWSASLPLEGVDVSAGLTLRFRTPAFRSSRDVRKLGVALSRVIVR